MKKLIAATLCCFMIILSAGEVYAVDSEENSYTGPYVTVGDVTLPLSEHMPGTFFTKDGKACTCHNTASGYCIASVGNCNCMRYYPTGVKETCEVDLLGAQCFAFARLVFYKCFGFIDSSQYSSLFYSVGSLSSGEVTAESVKALLTKAASGAHVRLSKGHSVSILTMDDESITVYHGNSGGNGVATEPCVISTRRFTWEQFASYSSAGIQYVNMPYDYPDSETFVSNKVGYYKLTSNLNLRASATTQSESLGVVPINSTVLVTAVDGYWGRIQHGELEGWIFLQYTNFVSSPEVTPSGERIVLGDDGYLRISIAKLTVDSLMEYFDSQNLRVTTASGEEIPTEGFVGTGSVVSIQAGDETVDSTTVLVAGDLDGNGAVDAIDYTIAKRIVLGTVTPDPLALLSADVSRDGSVDTVDYTIIKRYCITETQSLLDNFVE